MLKAPKTFYVVTAFFVHVLRFAGAAAPEPVLVSACQRSASLFALVLFLALVVGWRFKVLLFS